MKRKILLVLFAAAFAAAISAQGWGPGWNQQGWNQNSMPAPETVTVSGSLVVAQGQPALKNGDITYFVSGINRLVGFVDELKEGAQITIEGMAFATNDSKVKFLNSSKLTLNGKIYELAGPGQFGRMMPNGGQSGRMAPTPMGGWCPNGGYGMMGHYNGYGHRGGRW